MYKQHILLNLICKLIRAGKTQEENKNTKKF